MDIDRVILAIIVITGITTYKGLSDSSFIEKYKFQVGSIRHKKEYHRMLTSALLHVDWFHFIINMYVLYIFAPVLTHNLSSLKFLVIYIGGIAAGSLMSLQYHKKDFYYSAIGASGGTAAIVYASIVLSPNTQLILFPLPIPLPSYLFGVGYFIYTVVGMKKQWGNIGHAAHLGGAISGYGLTLLLAPYVMSLHQSTVLLLGIPILIFLVFGKHLRK